MEFSSVKQEDQDIPVKFLEIMNLWFLTISSMMNFARNRDNSSKINLKQLLRKIPISNLEFHTTTLTFSFFTPEFPLGRILGAATLWGFETPCGFLQPLIFLLETKVSKRLCPNLRMKTFAGALAPLIPQLLHLPTNLCVNLPVLYFSLVQNTLLPFELIDLLQCISNYL